jgi:UDP-N-acetylglucosamine--N-acetylmuramyl-(pentapeptide) pyrophosphoryl-undecaprenol N-acetylglucosamine transferase
MHNHKKHNQHLGSLTILFAGGGTGGHLYPAIAVAEELSKRIKDVDIHFVGTRQGLEARVIPRLGFKLHFNAIRGLRRKLDFENVLLPFRIMASSLQCLKLLHQVGPHVVVGTGGYVSGPTLFYSALLGIPTLIQEQNSFPGVTTRLLAFFVNRVHLSFKESCKYFRSKRKLFISGNPVRTLPSGIEKSEARQKFGLDPNKNTLLVFGGSQGARAINQAMTKALPRILKKSDAQIIWGTGNGDYSEVVRAAKVSEHRIKVLEYIDDMRTAYSASDLVLSRSGASTLAEITCYGLPSILVPYPFATAGHQETNARTLEASGAAVVILQKELEFTLLADKIIELFHDDETRKKMGNAAKAISNPRAAECIVDSLLELIALKSNMNVTETRESD